jgi:hypothetical protein
MIKQFLLNSDGSVPEGTNAALLEAEGIPLVVPTERWTPKTGFMLEERDPEQDEQGVWRQVWAEVVAPEPDVATQEAVEQD